MKKENIKYIIIASLIGILIGKYVFNQYKVQANNKVIDKTQNIYLMQYGVYSSKESMENNAKSLESYFYFNDKDGYHVLIGITKNENLKAKIVESYNIKDNIYMKRVKVDNEEFLNLLDQYDKLVESTEDTDVVLSSQKQILSKYEELILISE